MSMLSISLLWVVVMVSSCTCQIKNPYGAQDYEISSWKMSNTPTVTPVQTYRHPYYFNQPTSPPTTTTTTTTARPPPKNNVQYGNYYSPPAKLYYPASPPAPAQVTPPVSVPVPLSSGVRVSFGDNSRYTKAAQQQEQQQQYHYQQQSPKAPIIPIIQFDQEIKEGEFNRFHFIAANGIEEEQETIIQKYPDSSASSNYGYNNNNINNYNPNDGHAGCLLVKRGKYSYWSPEGQRVEMQWIADANGFRPQGSHIPTSVLVPSQIRQLNYY